MNIIFNDKLKARLIMQNSEVINEIDKLIKLYQDRWNTTIEFVDYLSVPNITQERLLIVLRLIVDSGDSLLVGYGKFQKMQMDYIKWLENYHKEHRDLPDGFVFDKSCPFCNGKVSLNITGKSYSYDCATNIVLPVVAEEYNLIYLPL